MNGGGELLRAVMAASSLTSSPFFYCVELTGQDGTAATTTIKTTVLQLKSQSYFLMTSLFGLTSNIFVNAPEFIGIYDAANGKPIVNGQSTFAGAGGTPFADLNCAYAGLFNDTLASCVTLPEYILWAPNSLVGVTWMGSNNVGASLQEYRYLVLAGIEYELKGS